MSGPLVVHYQHRAEASRGRTAGSITATCQAVSASMPEVVTGLNLGDTSGATHKNHVMHRLLVNARVHSVAKVILAQLLEARPGQAAGVVNAFEQGVNLNG